MAYNEFAYFYDEFNGEADYDALYEQIRQELNAHDIRDGILADLGCGTGELTLMLTQAGYDMIGIDQSEEMLCVVRDKAEQLGLSGKLLLLQQDLLKLDLYGTIRGAVSTFDTFNHIPDLDTAIANAAFFMEEGGVFLFDMNTPYKHQKVLGENVFTFEEEDAACVWRNHYHPADRRVEITVDIDYRETGEHFHEQFYEYTYDLDTIRAALEKHGFALEKVCDGESFGPLTEESERYFFCAVPARELPGLLCVIFPENAPLHGRRRPGVWGKRTVPPLSSRGTSGFIRIRTGPRSARAVLPPRCRPSAFCCRR